jgi:hypothetical protein
MATNMDNKIDLTKYPTLAYVNKRLRVIYSLFLVSFILLIVTDVFTPRDKNEPFSTVLGLWLLLMGSLGFYLFFLSRKNIKYGEERSLMAKEIAEKQTGAMKSVVGAAAGVTEINSKISKSPGLMLLNRLVTLLTSLGALAIGLFILYYVLIEKL